MEIYDLISDGNFLLDLTPEELAGFVLEHFHSKGDPDNFTIHRADFVSTHVVQQYSKEIHKQCQKALMEAWNYLEREGFIAPEPANQSPVYFITRRGKNVKSKIDLESYCHAALFPKSSIHTELYEKVYPLFIRGEYETAVFQAFKIVEVNVRAAAGSIFSASYGIDLMRKAFHPENGPLTDKTEPISERESLQALFAGSIGRFKNPSSHRHVTIINPSETIEMIQFASHLLRIVDDRRNK